MINSTNTISIIDNGRIIKRIYPNDVLYNNHLKLGDGREGLRKIDKTWQKFYNGFSFEFAPDLVTAPPKADGSLIYTDTFGNKQNTLHITPIDTRSVAGSIENISCGAYSGSAIVYYNAFGKNIDLIYLPTANDLLKIIRIKNTSNEKLTFKFKIDFDKDKHSIDFLAEKIVMKNVTFTDKRCQNINQQISTTLKPPITWDDFGNQQICNARFYESGGDVILEKNIDLSLFGTSQYVYSDLALSYKAESASGYIRNIASSTSGSQAGWNSIRSNTLSDSDPNILQTNVYSNLTDQTLAYFNPNSSALNSPQLNRSFFAFDTTSLSGLQIQSASLNFFFYHFENNTSLNQNNASFAITKGERLNPASLIESDWKKSGGLSNIDLLSNSVKYKDILTQIFTTMHLNHNGIAQINKSGISDFAVRDTRDIKDSYSSENSSFDAAYMYSEKYSNAILRPYLEVITGSAPSNIFAVNTVPFSSISNINGKNKSSFSKINTVSS